MEQIRRVGQIAGEGEDTGGRTVLCAMLSSNREHDERIRRRSDVDELIDELP